MFQSVAKKLFGTKNERELKKIQPIVDAINAQEADLRKLSDGDFPSKMAGLKTRRENGESLDDLLIDTFALVREAGRRVLEMRHFDCQLVGGVVLHRGMIAEMKTGEGKTLVATLPMVLNALEGKGAHLITVNDYLASRDRDWMGQIYARLGLTSGVIVHGLDDSERKNAYGCDITYGTNHEFGFDYLRDNMKLHIDHYVQRDLHYCIVDEVDSILIDEARTPLIISGRTDDLVEKYYMIDSVIPRLNKETDYTVDEKDHVAALTDDGVAKVQKLLGVKNLYDPNHIDLVHHVDQALRAHTLYRRDREYVVREGEVVIVDEFTGRLAEGRRFSDGLHQALEAKEKVKVEGENATLATITYQNFFRMYSKLAGMTGTADTEAEEFKEIYNLDVMVIPTNRPMIRQDHADVIYKTEDAKFKAAIEEIKELNAQGRPVLVGTISIEKSEKLSKVLKRLGIDHHVLNAKNHAREAEIVAQAGQPGAVTVSTNMAGRGTDIVLGEGVREAGGLHILGTERHESRRIDNQLRGRAGRQGDPGSSRFYLSLEDDLLRIFGAERIGRIMETLKMEEDIPIEHAMISRAIGNAQKRVEGRNFDIRKHLLKYDDVLNQQRKVIYAWRRKILEGKEIKQEALKLIEEVLEWLVDAAVPQKAAKRDWDVEGLNINLDQVYGLQVQEGELAEVATDQEFFEMLKKVLDHYARRESEMTEPVLRHIERLMLLHTVDDRWREHLENMTQLRDGINLRGYAQKDPLHEYQREGFTLFNDMFRQVKTEIVTKLFKVQISQGEDVQDEMEAERRERQRKIDQLNMTRGPEGGERQVAQPMRREAQRVGRNDPCPCGSGKKYKKCHGA